MAPPDVAVTVKEYVFDCVAAAPPPPPQAEIAKPNINSSKHACAIRIIFLP
jgi:hypothetical protein